jgi:hypothetical protein
MGLPTRARDVLELSDRHVRFRFGRGEDTATFRILQRPGEVDTDTDTDTDTDAGSEPDPAESAGPAGEPARCERCADPLEAQEREICRECINQAAGLCRWCGERPPGDDGELCAGCEADARRVCAAGSFDSISDLALDSERPS